MKVQCDTCAYKKRNPGTAHIRCLFDWSGKTVPAGSVHGIVKGWYMFPLNYDPVWMAEECSAWAEEQDPAMLAGKYDPILEMLAMLR